MIMMKKTNIFKQIFICASLSLMLFAQHAMANELESCNSVFPTVQNDSITQIQDIDPFQYRLQKRHKEVGDAFPRKNGQWFRHFTIGGFGGLNLHTPQTSANLNSDKAMLDRGYNYGGILQYDITRLHAVRLMISRTRFNKAVNLPYLNANEVMLGYDFNLTNYFKGYNERRRFSTSIFAGIGLSNMDNGQETYKTFRSELGLKFEYAMLKNLSVFAEPYLSILPDNYDRINTSNKFEYLGGVRAGLKVRPYVWAKYYDSFKELDTEMRKPAWYQRFFFGGTFGVNTSNNRSLSSSRNVWTDIDLYLGYRVGAMSSLRMLGSAQRNRKGDKNKNRVSAELDYMIDLISPFAGYKNNPKFRLYGYGGLGTMYTEKNQEEEGTTATDQQSRNQSTYLTAGLSLHYFFSPNWSVFAEPWVGKGISTGSKDRMGGVRIGGQFSMTDNFINANRSQAMSDWYKRPISHLFYGISSGVGTFSHYANGNLNERATTIPVNLFLGYRFSPIQALRLQTTYLQPIDNAELKPEARRFMGHLDYMLNFTNLTRGYQKDRHLTFSGFAGVGVRNMGEYEGEQARSKASPMVILGAQMDYRLNNGISLYVEPWATASITKQLSEYELGYGVNAGLSLNLENAHIYGPAVGGVRHKDWSLNAWRHLFIGAASGYTMVNHKGTRADHLPLMAYVGYKFTPVQSLRLRGMYQKTLENNDPCARTSVHIDYMQNLTNLFAGYRPNRIFELQSFVGLGIQHHDSKRYFFEDKLSVKDELSVAATLGLNAKVRIKNGFGVFVEPQIAFYNNRRDASSNVDIYANALAGVNLDLEPIHAYHPSFGRKSKLWNPSLGERFFAGVSFGYQHLVHSEIGTTPITSYLLGYRISPIHAMRLRATYNYRHNYFISPRRRISASMDYMFNMTNMLNEYDPKRRLNFTGLLSFVIGYNEVCKIGGFNKDGKIDTKFGVKLGGGLNVSYTVFPGIDAFIEPSVSVALGSPSTMQHRYMMSLSGGVVASIQSDPKVYGEARKTMGNRLFYEGAMGWVIPTNASGSQNKHGLSVDGRMGVWLNSLLGVRGSLIAQNYYSGAHYNTYSDYWKKQSNGVASTFKVLARGEMLVNPLNLTKTGRESANSRKLDLNLAFGFETGYASRTAHIGDGKDISIPYGLTASAQLMYRTSPYTSLFIEPRYQRTKAGFRQAVSPSFGNSIDKLFTIHAGFRLQTPTREQKRAFVKQDSTIFVPHSFASLRLGGYRAFSKVKSINGGRIASMLTADYGYAFTAKHALKLQVSASRFVNHSNNHRYALLDYGILYMGNLTNMFTGTQVNRKLNVYGEVGPMFVSMVGHTAKAPCGRHFASGAAAGLMATYKLTDNLSVTAEGLGQMMDKRSILPGQGGSLLNCLRVNMTAGVQYNF